MKKPDVMFKSQMFNFGDFKEEAATIGGQKPGYLLSVNLS